MKKIMTQINTFLKKIISFFPTNLPVGMTEFTLWSDSIIELSGKFADEDSMRFALASMVIHMPPTKSRVSKRYFINSLRKSAANQIASQVFQDIKIKQAKKAEDTAKAIAESNGQSEKTT